MRLKQEISIFKKYGNLSFAIFLLTVTLSLSACAIGSPLRTDGHQSFNDIQGSYTLILYGGNFGEDLETVAILDKEGDEYTFEPYAPDFSYRVRKGLSAAEALKKAESFIGASPEFHDKRLMGIRNEKGNIIGYELRPLYFPLTFGTDDVLDVNYRLKGNTVHVFVTLKPSVEDRRRDFDRDDR